MSKAEDIERIQNIIATYRIFGNVPMEENDIKALENIVERYKELEEEKELHNDTRQLFENSMLGYINGYEDGRNGYEDGRNGTTGLAYKVGKQFADYTLTLRLNQYKEDYLKARRLLEDSIPKSLIKEKIEELNDMIIETHRGNVQRYTVSEILSFIRFCEELLKEGKG